VSIESSRASGNSPTDCRVAVLGFGTVGSAVARRLAGLDALPGVTLSHIVDRRAHQKRQTQPACSRVCWTTSIEEVLQSDADVIVEAIGGLDPAADWIRDALTAGKSVVTANKQVIARDGERLLRLAARQGRQLRFEAAVGGAMPIVRAIGDGLSGDRLTRIVAILNGTTNAVLSRMEATGCALGEAVDAARLSGYAEADPAVDLDGGDARAKLAILCALAFNLRVDPTAIATRSVTSLRAADFPALRRRGATIRQLAHAEYDERRSALTAWVAPAAVPRTSLFARTAGPRNAAIITGRHSGDVGISGAGAGGDATAVAILSDLVAIARDRAAIVSAPVLSVPHTIHGLEAARWVDLQGRSTTLVDLLARSEDRPRPTTRARRDGVTVARGVPPSHTASSDDHRPDGGGQPSVTVSPASDSSGVHVQVRAGLRTGPLAAEAV
jgi:homoserine dehydrogenase